MILTASIKCLSCFSQANLLEQIEFAINIFSDFVRDVEEHNLHGKSSNSCWVCAANDGECFMNAPVEALAKLENARINLRSRLKMPEEVAANGRKEQPSGLQPLGFTIQRKANGDDASDEDGESEI